ncbi:hypothetical protein [Trinickia mobilis]|uniref:hypothetical protein n=1 Tax=Trinickia mobilis TaxID=2816356 RepID=UPI001F5CF1B4|nr:hypothetical protein [Trinickia mobilis]
MNTISPFLKAFNARNLARTARARGTGVLLIASAATLAACGGGGGSGGAGGAGGSADSANGQSAPKSMTCGTPSAAASAASSSNLIQADTPGSDGTRLFAVNSPFNIALTTQATQSDTLNWQVLDNWNVVRASGSFPVQSGAHTVTLSCSSSLAGYFAISATLANEGGQLNSMGTRPQGIATFGILPDVSGTLPAVSYAREDQYRFGGQGTAFLPAGGTDGYRPLYTDLGLSWANDNRNWYMEEPNGPNTFVPGTNTLASYFQKGDIMRLIQLDGIPGWASPTGSMTESYAPASEAAMQNYMSRVGTDSAQIRAAYFPNQSKNYYQVTWEPDGGGPTQWLDTQANFVAMYQAVYNGIHSTDPNAVVMGVTDSLVRTNTQWLQTYAPLGLAEYLDGLTIHGYYDAGTYPSHPPERLATDPSPANAANALPASMRELRNAMNTYLKPGAKLFVTETGISYDSGTSYGANYPTQNELFAHGAVVARTHLILLGEGADMTYVFYASDPPVSPPGYGIFFDLADAQGAYGSSNISPKPAAMEVAAMTRIIDGTHTLGYLNNVPTGVYAYAFQRLNGGKIVTALWTHNNANWSQSSGYSATYSAPYTLTVDSPGASGTVTVLDVMGNASTLPYSNGQVALTLTESPIYVVSANASVMQANVTRPVGYTGQ